MQVMATAEEFAHKCCNTGCLTVLQTNCAAQFSQQVHVAAVLQHGTKNSARGVPLGRKHKVLPSNGKVTGGLSTPTWIQTASRISGHWCYSSRSHDYELVPHVYPTPAGNFWGWSDEFKWNPRLFAVQKASGNTTQSCTTSSRTTEDLFRRRTP